MLPHEILTGFGQQQGGAFWEWVLTRMLDDSVLVAEIYAAKKDADGAVIESALGRRIPGEMKAIALIHDPAVIRRAIAVSEV